jgi:hyperosmotically inducible protein
MSRHPIAASLTLGALFLAAAVAVTGCGESASSSATNTATNARDRDGKTATPPDQSNSTTDVELAASIRKALVADDSLSTNAKNVKIVTENGGVTLRGPVNDGRERETVVRLAKQAAGPRNVVDQLDVAKP